MLRENLQDCIRNYDHHVSTHASSDDGCSCTKLPNVNARSCPVTANRNFDYFSQNFGYPCDVWNPQFESSTSTIKMGSNGSSVGKIKKDVKSENDDVQTYNDHSKAMKLKLKQRVARNGKEVNKNKVADISTRRSFLDEIKSRST